MVGICGRRVGSDGHRVVFAVILQLGPAGYGSLKGVDLPRQMLLRSLSVGALWDTAKALLSFLI